MGSSSRIVTTSLYYTVRELSMAVSVLTMQHEYDQLPDDVRVFPWQRE